MRFLIARATIVVVHELVIVVAKYFVGLSVLGAFIVWLRLALPEKKQFIVFAIVAAALSLVLAKIGNKLYYDPRPFVAGHFTPYIPHAADNGFPSDHTLFASFLAFTSWRYSRKAGITLFALAILIGASRVIAGVHHWADIAGSIVAAAIGTTLAYWLTRRLGTRQPKTSAPE